MHSASGLACVLGGPERYVWTVQDVYRTASMRPHHPHKGQNTLKPSNSSGVIVIHPEAVVKC